MDKSPGEKPFEDLTDSQSIEDQLRDMLRKPTNTINCNVTGDKNGAFIHDVITIAVNGTEVLVVTDSQNLCIKSFYNKDNSLHHSKLELENSPRAIARLEGNKLAVILPNPRKIVVVSVTPDLSRHSTIVTTDHYCGLTALTSTTLAATGNFPPSVDILDMSGKVLRSINPVVSGQKLIQNPHYICATKKGNILVTANMPVKCILCLTPDGDVVFNYSPSGEREMRAVAGITVTDTDDILVADQMAFNVIQLNEAGQFVKNILSWHNRISHPYGIHYSESGRIYVSRDRDTVDVYTFQ